MDETSTKPIVTVEILERRVDNLEKVIMRLISQVEHHEHLPSGKSAVPLGV